MRGFLALAFAGLVLLATGVLAQECTNKVADLVFVIDSSGSIEDKGRGNWLVLLQFVNSIIENLDISERTTRVGVVMYSNVARHVFFLRDYTDKQQVMRAVLDLQFDYMGGTTNTSGGLRLMFEEQFTARNGDRAIAPNIAIVITDGESNVDQQFTVRDAQRARSAGVQMFAIGITDAVDENEVRQLSSSPQQRDVNYWLSPGFDVLARIADTIARQTACVTTPRPVITTPSTNPDCTATVSDLVFVLDSSGSIRDNNRDNGPDNWLTILEFVTAVIDLLNIGTTATRVGMVQFSNYARNVFFLKDYRDKLSLKEAVLLLEEQYMGGTTNTSGGIRVAHFEQFAPQNGDRPGVQNIIVLVTDGASNEDTERTIPDAISAREENVQIFSVGVTDQINEEELKTISSLPQLRGQNYWTSTEFDALQDVVQVLATQTCRPTVAPTTNPDCKRGYADLVFVLDSSGSIRDNNPPDGSHDNWKLMLDFIMSVVSTLPVGFDQTRVGLVQYSNYATSRFYLNQYWTTLEVLEAVAELQDEYIGSTTNTSGGLRVMMRDQFQVVHGDRPNIENVAVILTDGESNDDKDRTIPDAEVARNSGISIYAIGISNKVNVEEVKGISNLPQLLNQNYWLPEDFKDLGGLVDALSSVACGAESTVSPLTTLPSTLSTFPTSQSTEKHFPSSLAPTTPMPSPTTTVPTTSQTTVVTTPGCSRGYADLVFVLDSSGSIRDNNPPDGSYDNWKLMLDFIMSVVSTLPIGLDQTRVGLVQYSNYATSRFYLNQYWTTLEVLEAVAELQDEYIGGTTNTSGGLRVMMRDQFQVVRGDRPNVGNIAVVLTDGESNDDKDRTIPDAEAARNANVQIYSIGISNKVNLDEVKGISSLPQELNKNYWLPEDFLDLSNLVDALSRSTCGGQTPPPVDPSTLPPSLPPTTPVPTTPVPTSQTTSQEISTVMPTICPACYSAAADLVFIVDDSSSIRDTSFGEKTNWVLIKEFLKKFVGQIVLDDSHFKVGLVKFANSARNEWYLSQYRRKEDVIDAIDRLQFNGGQTNTAAALRTMHSEQFQTYNGDRQNIQNIAVLLTDGASDIDSRNTILEAKNAKDKDIRIFAIGVGNQVSYNELTEISSAPHQQDVNYFTVADFRSLNSLLTNIVSQVCAPPPPPPGPPGPPGPRGPSGPSGPPGQSGFPGPSGNPGFPGPPGQTGFAGPVGSTGPRGPSGPSGRDGIPGATGPRGPSGPSGEPGSPGPRGPAGPVGGTGATGQVGIGQRGPSGPQGSPGSTGATGLPGPVGPSGPAGFAGPIGPSGPSGPSGQKGMPGEAGRPGEAGAAGIPGARGAAGATGATGIAGLPGQSGRDGQKGRTGATGMPGVSGQAGASGSPGEPGRRGSPGPLGPAGATGATGPGGATGSAGPAGPRGPAGFPGPVGSAGTDGQPGGTGTPGRPGIPGAPGLRGINGPTGGTGATGRGGPTGATGSTGPAGRSGANGQAGQAGLTGATGAIGPRGQVGSAGQRGFPGAVGPAGTPGSTGTPGRPGVNGLPGPTGGTGATGREGAPGLDGRPGEAGRAGSQGATGLPGVGIPGQPGPIGSEGRPGPAGPSGQPGPQGERGLPGQPGANGFPGTDGRPGPAGTPGRSGALGPIGQPGAPGLAGANGQPGTNGRTGATGTPGRPGSDGIPGRNGINGRTGSQGLPGLQGARGVPGPNGLPGATGSPGQAGRDGQAGPQGISGLPGTNGRTGATGQAGPVGLPGTPGQAGFEGRPGQPGSNGIPGQTGATGQPGLTGATGRPGSAGQAGQKGRDGNPGPAGTAGLPGSAGRTGATGQPGFRGIPGLAGARGVDGQPGRTGATGQSGQPGLRGEAGRNGEPGPPGIAGFPGRTGATGFPGPAGQPGLDGRPGSAGQPGEQGLPGPRGLDGQPGQPGANGRSGALGGRGAPGVAGGPGQPGRVGPPGPLGPSGLPGPRGAAGSPGANGIPGRSGALGAPGSRGEPGAAGSPGRDGSPGSPGRNGPTGATGFPGPNGRSGATGPRGINGGIGATGLPGVAGIAGSPGRNGQPGRTGATGQSGRPGPSGRQGPRGLPGIGRTGATGLPGLDGGTGSPGQPGRAGSAGPRGQPGRAGSTGASGMPGPPGSAGRGLPGPAGPPGPLGSAGPPGSNGGAGPLGPPGPPGPAGEGGPRGPQGPPGASVAFGCDEDNECLDGNGGCSQYCIDTFDSYYCACRYGYELVNRDFQCPSAACSGFRADVVFILDSSGSIRDAGFGNWQLVLDFVNDVIEKLTIGFDQTRVGLVYYSNDARHAFFLRDYSDKRSLQAAVNRVESLYIGGTTNTSGGLRLMNFEQYSIRNGDRPDVQDVAILITDGASNVDQGRTIPDAQAAKQRGVRIFSIGITNSINEQELRSISSQPQQRNLNYFTSPGFSALDMVVDTLISSTCAASPNYYCRYSSEAKGDICYCRFSECDTRPVNGSFCTNINECRVDNGGCQQECTDVEGSYNCRCLNGFNLAKDGKACDDLNECDRRPCGGNDICANTYGSYYCLNRGGAAALVDDGEFDGNLIHAGVTKTGLAMASALSAAIAILVSLVVVLVVRQVRVWRSQRSIEKKWSNGVSNRTFGDNHNVQGFSTMRSKFAIPNALDDTISTLSSTS